VDFELENIDEHSKFLATFTARMHSTSTQENVAPLGAFLA